MNTEEVISQLGIENCKKTEAFKHEEDEEYYNVWRIETDHADYVLKKASEKELSVYDVFLKSCKHGVPKLMSSIKYHNDVFLLLEYIDGKNLQKCDRRSLTAVLDELIYLQDIYWERRDLGNLGYGFDESLLGREKRGRYLNDSELEKAYNKYLLIYSELPRTLCHDDLLPFNVIISDCRTAIIDWEYAGILPYPTSLVRLIAHGEADETGLFCMTEDDKSYAVDYYFEHFIKNKGIDYNNYRKTIDFFLLFEYCEWIMLGVRYGDTESERYKNYYAKAKSHIKKLGGYT